MGTNVNIVCSISDNNIHELDVYLAENLLVLEASGKNVLLLCYKIALRVL